MAFGLPNEMPRVALVTGAAKRIGRAIAEALASDGFALALHYRTSAIEVETLAEAIRAKGGRAIMLQADLAKEAEVKGLVGRASDTLGPLGCLINNASLFEYDEALNATRASWDSHVETNLRAPLVLTQDFARALPPKAEGCVINLLDQRVWNLTPHFVSYTLSKAGLWTLTQTLALALAPRIRVVAIGPGPILPNIHQSEAQFAAQVVHTPLQRGASPEEVAETVRFLLRARALTGQMIALDGGQHLGWSMPTRGETEE
jgi:NAD(P)-dependent dehydrogenase (short-subunit alcohol dehydrogenase family)